MNIKNARLESVLGNNELRSYLAGKDETADGRPLRKQPYLMPHSSGFTHTPKVLLVSPPISVPRHMQKRCIPPLGLSYIAAMLEKEGCEVTMIDCCVEGHEMESVEDGFITYGLSPEALGQRLPEANPDIIGLSVLFSNDLPNAMKVAAVLRDRFPGTPIVMGGLHPTIYPEQVFAMAEGCIDWILRGEGEYRMLHFIRYLQVGLVDVNADGLVGYLNGKWICNPQIETIANLDLLPFPAYHLLPMERYFEINIPFSPVPKGDRVMQILSSRGCPIGCSFCASTNLYKRYRTRSVGNVVAEIEHWKEEFGIDEIQFADDNLTLVADRTRELMNALENVDLPWCTPNGTMVNTITTDLLEAMRKAGLYQITLSIDSGSVKTLKEQHHKPVDLDRVPGLIAACEKLGVWTHGTLVIGMPGETKADIQTGLDFVMENLHFTSISTFIAQPIPGSELFHAALESGLVDEREARITDSSHCRMRLSNIDPKELDQIAADFQNQFTAKARTRDPEAYQAKYGRILRRGLVSPEKELRLT